MTDNRERRITTLTEAARRKSEEKTKAAEAAIRALIKRGEPITFQAIQRQAGVSHSFLYTHPILRDRIERLRQQNKPTPPPAAATASGNNIVLALTAEVARLKKQHREETQRLRAALEQAHGESLELRRELTRRGWTGPPTRS
jgi:hypothetical protein